MKRVKGWGGWGWVEILFYDYVFDINFEKNLWIKLRVRVLLSCVCGVLYEREFFEF